MAGTWGDRNTEALRLQSVSREYSRLYRQSNAVQDIEESIVYLQEALLLPQLEANLYWDIIGDLSQRLQQRFDALHEVRDLEKSIELRREQLDHLPTSHEDLRLWKCLLSDQLWKRYDLFRSDQDLVESVKLAREALAGAASDDPQRQVYLITAEQQLDAGFEAFADPEHLDEAIVLKRERLKGARAKASANVEVERLDPLSHSLYKRHRFKRNTNDLKEALQLALEARERAPPGMEKYSLLISNIGNILAAQSEITEGQSQKKMDEALEVLTEAMRLSPSGPMRAGVLVNLMCKSRELYEETGRISRLEAACAFGRQAIVEIAENDRKRPMYLHDLAICLKSISEAAGRPEALDEAIVLYRQAAADPNIMKLDKAMVSSNLCIALMRRYATSGSMADTKEAIECGKRAVSLIPHGHNSRPVYLNSLGNAWSAHYDRFKDRNELDEAIECAKQALQESLPLEPDRGMFLNNLSTKIWARFLISGSGDDRKRSMELLNMAVEQTGKSDTMRPQYVHNLGARYYAMYQRSINDRTANLDRSVALATECLDATPDTHVEWSDYATSLGWRQLKKAGETEDWSQFDTATRTFISAHENRSALPLTRVEAGRAAGLLLMTRDRWVEADKIYRNLIGLLSRASPRTISKEDMQHRLLGLSNVSAFTAGAALTVRGRPRGGPRLIGAWPRYNCQTADE